MQLKPESATLYRAAISLGAQEAQLIWTRHAGFIIMNGFLVSALSNNEIRQQTIILAVLGLIALVLNCFWHILNYAGWLYQHLFYRSAGELFDSEIGLLTDRFRAKDFKHGGWIYWLAQTIPIMFSLTRIACVGIAASTCIGIVASCVIGVALWLACAVVVWFVEYKKIARQGAIEPA